MRIHTDTLTLSDLYKAADKAATQITVSEHKSRKRDHAFEVKLTGLSNRRPNFWNGDESDYAATWDQWGVFLGFLYDIDSGTIAGTYYADALEFGYKTCDRFALDYSDPIPFPLDHDHRWEFSGTPREFECTRGTCDAIQRGA